MGKSVKSIKGLPDVIDAGCSFSPSVFLLLQEFRLRLRPSDI